MEVEVLTSNKQYITEQDAEMITMFSNGKRALDIAKHLGISRRTVEAHVNKLQGKFKCKSIAHLVATFIRYKLIE